ncbi:MAG TPA: chemotaxis protein CheW [Candidatus Thermoplasmatota archaeon]|nr:chemotaxis protein CheW [Candidatus Thermoplasmatota archaeon]
MPVGTESEIREKTASSDDRQLVVFKISKEEFGVDINEVKEIIRWTDVTRIPSTESYIKGVINLRGNIVVVNDLAMKLGLPSKPIDDETRILVVEVGENNTVGMVVDSATEVLRLDGEKVKAPPEMVTQGIDQNYIDGVGVLNEKRLLTLLNLAKVMKSQDYEKILQAQRSAEQNITQQQKKEIANDSKEQRKNPADEAAKPEETTKKKELKPESEIKKTDSEESEKKSEGNVKTDNAEKQKTKKSESSAKKPSKSKTKTKSKKQKTSSSKKKK